MTIRSQPRPIRGAVVATYRSSESLGLETRVLLHDGAYSVALIDLEVNEVVEVNGCRSLDHATSFAEKITQL